MLSISLTLTSYTHAYILMFQQNVNCDQHLLLVIIYRLEDLNITKQKEKRVVVNYQSHHSHQRTKYIPHTNTSHIHTEQSRKYHFLFLARVWFAQCAKGKRKGSFIVWWDYITHGIYTTHSTYISTMEPEGCMCSLLSNAILMLHYFHHLVITNSFQMESLATWARHQSTLVILSTVNYPIEWWQFKQTPLLLFFPSNCMPMWSTK